jgi:hypothetical protein
MNLEKSKFERTSKNWGWWTKMKFISNNQYQYIRYGSIGVDVKDIQKYNKGIQFVNGIYETEDINIIQALRSYTQLFINKGVQPLIWEEGQEIIIEDVEETVLTEPNEYKMKLEELESFIRQ